MKNSTQIFLVLGILGFCLLFRFLPTPANFSPIGALALFGAFAVSNRYLAIFLALSVLFVSDLFLGFYEGMAFVYGGFLLVALLGRGLRSMKGKLAPRVLGASLLGSFTFFVVSNFGVWATSGLYPKNLAGLAESYVMAVPFFHQSLFGDLFFNALAFGSWALASQVLLSRQSVKNI